MKTTKKYLLSLIALALLISPGAIRNAEAGIRVSATLRTPNVRVRLNNSPVCNTCNYRCDHRNHRNHRDHRDQMEYRITRRDRRIAGRLAWYAGLPTREVLRLKRMGYDWRQIGRWLDVPPRVVRASLESRDWKRYRDGDHHRHASNRGRDRRSDHRLTYYDRDNLR